jgi:hypothetical protein
MSTFSAATLCTVASPHPGSVAPRAECIRGESTLPANEEAHNARSSMKARSAAYGSFSSHMQAFMVGCSGFGFGVQGVCVGWVLGYLGLWVFFLGFFLTCNHLDEEEVRGRTQSCGTRCNE